MISSFAALGAVSAALASPISISTAPITQVTVYSDRAQVTRSAIVQLQGGEAQTFALPLLLDSIDSTSLRVIASGGDVERVDITYVPASEFPRERAQKLLNELIALDAEIDRLQKERAVWQGLLDQTRSFRAAVSNSDPLRPPSKLNPSGWSQGVALVRSNAARAQNKLMAIDLTLRTLGRKRRPLAEEAQKLGGLRPRSGYRVTALVRGKGTAQLQLTYMVSGARWQPTYDIQLQPSTGKVQLQLAGAVSQESGEDWTDAALVLSTAVPATATRYPKIPSWSIGERERFIPTPRPVQESIPAAPPLHPRPRPPNNDEVLRSALQRHGYASGPVGPSTPDPYPESQEAAREQAAPLPPVMAPPPPPAPSPAQEINPSVAEDRKESKYEELSAKMRSIMAQPSSSPSPRRNSAKAYSSAQPAEAPEPSESLGLLPPGGWVRPSYGPGLPASLAGGNDLTFKSIAKETILSGKGARRVALLSRSWPVTVERKLFPALAPDAYLVAELKSPEKDPLPGGQANLFVGADPAGTASLGLIVPGASFTLPLGLDAAIRPIRNVKVTTIEKGVISKDEVSEYTVTIEIANPHRTDVALRILDQIPLSPNKSVEVKLVRAEPAPALQDAASGALEWRLALGAGQKTMLTFVYTLKRPKGYRLYQ